MKVLMRTTRRILRAHGLRGRIRCFASWCSKYINYDAPSAQLRCHLGRGSVSVRRRETVKTEPFKKRRIVFMITQELNRGWCIRPCTRGDWEIKTNVPCSVLHAMLEAKLAPVLFIEKTSMRFASCLIRIFATRYACASKRDSGAAVCGIGVLRAGYHGRYPAERRVSRVGG